MTHVAVVGAGQLGATLCILLDRWRQLHGLNVGITLIDSAREPLLGATRSAWINHATGLEYFNRNDLKTAESCIQGAITKRLLLPQGLHKLPQTIRNRFFISTGSVSQIPIPAFHARAESAREVYGALRKEAEARHGFCDAEWENPQDVVRIVPEEDAWGISNVAAGIESAGGASNIAMDVAFKTAALLKAQKSGGIVDRIFGTSVDEMQESDDGVLIKIAGRTIKADYVICCAAHGNRILAKLSGLSDQSGAYMMNFMLHVDLPPADAQTCQKLASVNFVLQGEEHGAMFACIIPPTSTAGGVAALFAPGYSGSYLQICKDGELPTGWDQLMTNMGSFRFDWRGEAIVQRVSHYNPFLRDYLPSGSAQTARPIPGTVFNPRMGLSNSGGEDRTVRRMGKPRWSDKGKIMFTTTPKWTTVELAALTVTQVILMRAFPEQKQIMLPTAQRGYGPLNIDVPAVSQHMRIRDVKISRQVAENYLSNLGLPLRMIPDGDEYELFE